MFPQLFEMVYEADNVSDEQKARKCKKLGEVDRCHVDGKERSFKKKIKKNKEK